MMREQKKVIIIEYSGSPQIIPEREGNCNVKPFK